MSYEQAYEELVSKVTINGTARSSRVGNTYSVFGTMLEINELTKGQFPILTTRKMHPRPIWGELAAFLRGTDKLQDFKNLGCNYWDANAAAWPFNKNYPPAEHFVGKIYGYQWRNFNGVDQIEKLVQSLIIDPDSRRHILSAWNPADLPDMCLPPCHILAQFQVNYGQLDCIVYMRSVDLCLGLPTDVVLYATLLIVLAGRVRLDPGKLTFMMGDTHVYEGHLATWQIQSKRQHHTPPSYRYEPNPLGLYDFHPDRINLLGYVHEAPINYPLYA